MYPPGQKLTVRDGGIGLPSSATALPLIIGVTAGGVANTLYAYTDPNVLRDLHLSGPAVELAVPVIEAAGGCLLFKTSASTAGSNSAVTKTPFGTSTGTITLSGTARDSYRGNVKVLKTGALGVGTFIYTLDNGYEYSDETVIPAGGTYAAPGSGLTFTFVPGGGPVLFEAGDAHAFTTVAPHYTTGNLATAITAILAQIGDLDIKRVFFAGRNTSGANAATMAAAIAAHMTTLATNTYYARAMLDAGADTAANVKAAFAAFADARVAPIFGTSDLESMNAFAGWAVPQLPALNAAAERAAGADLSENLGRKESGRLRGVRKISDDEGLSAQFTEADKITTLRTYRGKKGFYVTNGYLKSPAGSDFLYWDWGCVIDVLCKIVVDEQDKWGLKKLRVLTDGTGRIDPRDSERINTQVRNAIKEQLLDPVNIEGYKGHVSGVGYSVDETTNFLNQRTFFSSAFAVPLVPVEGAETQIGFARSLT